MSNKVIKAILFVNYGKFNKKKLKLLKLPNCLSQRDLFGMYFK